MTWCRDKKTNHLKGLKLQSFRGAPRRFRIVVLKVLSVSDLGVAAEDFRAAKKGSWSKGLDSRETEIRSSEAWRRRTCGEKREKAQKEGDEEKTNSYMSCNL